MMQHKEPKPEQNSMNQKRKSTPEEKKAKTYWDRSSFSMPESSGHSQALAYTTNIAKRQMTPETLINGLTQNISSDMCQLEESEKSRCLSELNALRNCDDRPSVILTKAEKIVKSYFNRRPSQDIYKVFFDYYGIDVKQGHRGTTKYAMQSHQQHDGYPAELITEEHIDEVFADDQSDLLEELNSLYGTDTGEKLLELIRGGASSSLKTEIQVGFNFQGAYATSAGDMHRGELKDSDGKKAGEGVGTSIFLNSKKQLPYLQEANHQQGPPEDPRIILAHELIHALHAMMGVKPTQDTMIRKKPPQDTMIGKKTGTFMGSIDLDRWVDEELSEELSINDLIMKEKAFKGAQPDDIPVTGIMSDDIIFPKPLQAIKDINENQIRRELGLPLREAYEGVKNLVSMKNEFF